LENGIDAVDIVRAIENKISTSTSSEVNGIIIQQVAEELNVTFEIVFNTYIKSRK
jgi:hypothetical protein